FRPVHVTPVIFPDAFRSTSIVHPGAARKRSTSKLSGNTTLSEVVGTSFSVGTRRTYSVELLAGAFLGVMVTCAPAATGTKMMARARSVLRITGGVLHSAAKQQCKMRDDARA